MSHKIKNTSQRHIWSLGLLFGLALFLLMPTSIQASSPEGSVSVGATVPLSPIFANLLATMSTVQASVEHDSRVKITTTIIATDGIHFSEHPLEVRIIKEATSQIVASYSDITDSYGMSERVFDLTGQTGLFKIVVLNLAYQRPIELASTPTFFLDPPTSSSPIVITTNPGSSQIASLAVAALSPSYVLSSGWFGQDQVTTNIGLVQNRPDSESHLRGP